MNASLIYKYALFVVYLQNVPRTYMTERRKKVHEKGRKKTSDGGGF